MLKSIAVVFCLLLLASSSQAFSKTHFETRICRSCSDSHALTTAKSIQPAISCTSNGDAFDPDTIESQQCFSTPVNVLVIDADTRKTWQFENSHDNQGQPRHRLTMNVFQLPFTEPEVVAVANSLLDHYELLHTWTKQINEQLAAENRAFMNRSADDDPCKNSGYNEALDAAFSPRMEDGLQYHLQQLSAEDPNYTGTLSELKLTSGSFNFGNSGISMSGNWQVLPKPMRIIRPFGVENTNRPTQVGFSVNVVSGDLTVDINDNYTYFDGISLKTIKERNNSATLFSDCLGKALDEKFPKVIAGSGRSTPSYNNISLHGTTITSGIGGGGGGVETCKHTYYLNGVEVMSFEGACP